MLARRLRRRPNIKSTFDQGIVLTWTQNNKTGIMLLGQIAA